MKAADIKEGVVYAFARSRFDTPYFRPNEAIVLQVGGWHSTYGWASAPYAHPSAKDSLILFRDRPFLAQDEDASAPAEIALKYTRAQAIRHLDARRNNQDTAEADKPPTGWYLVTKSNRTIHMQWDEWLKEDERRDAETRVKLDKQREERALAAEKTAHIETILGSLGVLDAKFYSSQEQVMLTFEQIEQIASRLAVDA